LPDVFQGEGRSCFKFICRPLLPSVTRIGPLIKFTWFSDDRPIDNQPLA
jgi:hypothetical protein